MGIRNVMAAFEHYAGLVPPTSLVLLLRMSAVSKDTDAEPWYAEGHEALARWALGRGRHAEIDDSDLKAVERAMTPLRKIGAVTTGRRAAIRRDGANRARYRLHLGAPSDVDSGAPEESENGDDGDPPRPPKNGGSSTPEFGGRQESQDPSRPPKNGFTPPEIRPDTPRNPGGRGSKRNKEDKNLKTRAMHESATTGVAEFDESVRTTFDELKLIDELATYSEAIAVAAIIAERDARWPRWRRGGSDLTKILAEVRGTATENANIARLAEQSFNEFWATYPRRVARGAARKAWDKAVTRASTEEIAAGLRRYTAYLEAERTPERYIAHATTWLNQDRWTDQHSTQTADTSGPANYRNPPASAYDGYHRR